MKRKLNGYWRGTAICMWEYIVFITFNVKFTLHFEKGSHRYAWYKAGLEETSEKFVGINKFCFGQRMDLCNAVVECDRTAFIKCSYCWVDLCFEHFFIEEHYHKKDSDQQTTH